MADPEGSSSRSLLSLSSCFIRQSAGHCRFATETRVGGCRYVPVIMQRRLSVLGMVFTRPSLRSDRSPGGDRAERGRSSCASPRRPLEEFLVLGMHALFALGILVLSLFTLYLSVTSSLSGCCLEYRELHSSGESVVWAQCLARQGIHVLRQSWRFLNELYTISTSKWTRILVFFSVITQNGEV